ncbi:MAG: type I-C CRISPR-associated protein Cas8c/Csd1, partial [Nitrococcus sp.]|nr:type I-C CRISPR-associated protein Cas8c/Csd1 [Nitrococcus sp.]
WRLAHHHLAKLEVGQRTYYEKLLGEVMSEVNKPPAHLRIEQQGQFAIGYYHQRHALFQRRS